MLSIVLGLSENEIRMYGDTMYEYAVVSSHSAAADNEAAGLARKYTESYGNYFRNVQNNNEGERRGTKGCF